MIGELRKAMGPFLERVWSLFVVMGVLGGLSFWFRPTKSVLYWLAKASNARRGPPPDTLLGGGVV